VILFINVFLTEQKMYTKEYYARQNAKYSNKVDVFKYMLSSLENFYQWKKVVINVKLDDSFSDRKHELHNFIHKTFEKYPLVLNDKRNSWQSEWVKDFDLFDDDLILYLGNHDHIFTDPDPSYFGEVVNKYRNVDEYIGIQFSHWPEMCTSLWKHIVDTKEITILEDHFYCKLKQCHALQVINRKTYRMWWIDNKLPDIEFPRSDGVNSPGLDSYSFFEPMKIITLYREVCRHFDGYQHTIWEHLPNETVPVLEIPDGFFESNLRINYSSSYKKDFTNINPLTEKLKIFDENGFDLNIPKQVLPHFWKDKISEFQDDFSKIKFALSDEEISQTFIDRICNIWNYDPKFQTSNGGQILKNKIRHYYKNLFTI